MYAAEGLRAAADLLEEKGWCQGEYVDHKGAMCVSEALLRVSGMDAYCRFNEYLWNKYDGRPIISWNDDPKRTKEEVLAILRELADQAEKEGV